MPDQISDYHRTRMQLKDAQKFVNQRVKASLEQWKQQHPEAQNVQCKALNICYLKKPAHYYKVPEAVLRHMAIRDWALHTQKQILAEVQSAFPEFKISPSIWTREIPSQLFKKLQAALIGNTSYPVSIRGLKTLSQIKKTMQVALLERDAERKLNAEVSITKDNLTVNGTSYPITVRGSGSYKYPSIRVSVRSEGKRKRRTWINIEALLALLEAK